MSVHTTRDVVVECGYPDCTTTGKHWEFRKGEYCSTECETKHDGRKALADVKYSHTRCFTCFATLKEIEPPKPDEAFDETGTGWTWDPDEEWFTLEKYSQEESRESAVGFQHLTPDADVGEKDVKNLVTTGTVCGCCGNASHTAHIPLLVAAHPTAAKAVNHIEADDDHDVHAEHLHRTYAETRDIELAVGDALR